MATYKGIKGVRIESLASDPPAATSIGEVWYNTATSLLKYSIEGPGAWASTNDMNLKRSSGGTAGIQTAATCGGGEGPGHPVPNVNNVATETYDGNSWTTVDDMITARKRNSGQGTSTAMISTGGYTPLTGAASVTAKAETYDGTSWTQGNDTNHQRMSMGAGGLVTAGLLFAGGYTAPAVPVTVYDKTETYDGTTWTEVNDINSARANVAGGGIQTAAWLAGGDNMASTTYKLHEQYNGTCWSTSTDMGTARYHVSGCGSITAILCYGGGPPPTLSLVEEWNGSTWTEVADLGTGRYGINSATSGTTTAAMAGGGFQSWPVAGPTRFAGTEEWNSPVLTIKTVTVS